MSNRLIASLLLALAAFSTCVSATYFTAPAASTVWTTAAGQDITWKYQPGGAPNGDIILIGMSPTGSPITTTPLTVATNVDLTSESITFPDGLQLRTATRQYMLLMVDASNHQNVYSQVGPFEIQSFAAASDSSSSSASSSAASSSSSASSASSSSAATSSSSSSATSSSRNPVTATVIETASSGVLITMTLQPSSTSGGSNGGDDGDVPQTVTVTQSASASRAAASGANNNAGATSGAIAMFGGGPGLAAMGAAALVGALVL